MRDQGGSDARMTIRADGAPDHRGYNAPTAPEISVVMAGDGYSKGVATRDIVLYERTGSLQSITENNCTYDSLHYVLLFPSRDNGWHLNIPHDQGKDSVTTMEFYSFRLMIRSAVSKLHLSSRLFHQYIVDMYAKVEQQRLNYIKLNQHNIRVDLYRGLADLFLLETPIIQRLDGGYTTVIVHWQSSKNVRALSGQNVYRKKVR